MAKKKLTKYAQYRQQLVRKIASAKRKGLLVQIETPKTEKQLQRLGITEKQKSAETRKLKQLVNKFSQLEIINTETGEITSYKKAIKERRSESAKKSAETRKLNKQAEQRFWSGQEQPKQQYYPNGGDIITDNVIDTLINKLSSPTPEATVFEKKRNQVAYETSERERATLYALTLSVIARDGRSTVGWRLQEHVSTIDELLIGVLYASKQEQIEGASRELAQIINGGELSMSDIMDLAYEQEQNEDWSLPE